MRRIHRGLLAFCLAGSVAQADTDKLPPMHHVVGVPVSPDMKLPQTFPLGERRELICDTCHGVEDIEHLPEDEVDTRMPDFLHDGPYRALTEFCYRCHEKAEAQRNNVHVMFNAAGELDTQGCRYCHQETPDPRKPYERERMRFQLPRQKLCYGCHLKTPHLNALTHQSAPDEAMRETMRASERRLGVRLPLVEEDKVGCITCHTPHQSGVIDETHPGGRQVEDRAVKEGIAWRRTHWSRVFAEDKAERLAELQADSELPLPEYQRAEQEILLRLSARDGTLCQACHRFEDEP